MNEPIVDPKLVLDEFTQMVTDLSNECAYLRALSKVQQRRLLELEAELLAHKQAPPQPAEK